MQLPTNYTNLTFQERKLVREEYMRRQNGKCAHCKNDLLGPASEDILSKAINSRLFPPNFFKWLVHLHHCHHTGMTIGAVHCLCNAVLWQYYGK